MQKPFRRVNNSEQLASRPTSSEIIEIQSPAEVQRSHQQSFRNFMGFLEEANTLKAKSVNLRKYKSILGPGYQQCVTSEEIHSMMVDNMKKMNYNQMANRQWSKTEVIIMLWIIEKYNVLNKKIQQQYTINDWTLISDMMPGKNTHQCLFKWLSFLKNPLKKYPWTEEQNQMIRSLVNNQRQTNWTQVSQKLYLSIKQDAIFRSAKQCKEHYAYHLHPQIKKGHWNSQQDRRLMKLYLQYGHKWQKIATQMNGRTQNAVKNRINIIIQKIIIPSLDANESVKEKIGEYLKKISQNEIIRNNINSNDQGIPLQKKQTISQSKAPEEFNSQIEAEGSEQVQQQANDDASSTYARVNNDQYFTHATINQQKSVKFVSFVPSMSIQELLSYSNICSGIYCKENKTIVYKEIALGKKYTSHNLSDDKFFKETFVMENAQDDEYGFIL